MPLQTFLFLLPEITIFLGAMVLLMMSVFIKKPSVPLLTHFSFLILLSAWGMVWFIPPNPSLLFGQVIQDDFARLAKLIILGMGGVFMISHKTLLTQEKMAIPEYCSLLLFSLLGMMVMVSAKGFLSLFMGLELQSLSLYILTSIRRNDLKGSEAGIKYFLLGALSTGITLYGITFLYGVTGTLDFHQIRLLTQSTLIMSSAFYMGIIFVLTGMAFKIALVPFHMWLPDVYEGAPSTVTGFLASIPKVAALFTFARILSDPFGGYQAQWSYLIAGLSVFSLIIGGMGALFQKNIKRLLAYSAILNMGYALFGFLSGTFEGIQSSLLYVTIYGLTTLSFFMCLWIIGRDRQSIEEISDLSGVFKGHPGLTLIMVCLLFSFAGIPPFAGFLVKLSILETVFSPPWIPVALVGGVMSVVTAGYYLSIIKVMVMDEGDFPASSRFKIRDEIGGVLGIVITLSILTFFFIKPSFFMGEFTKAIKALSVP